MSKGFMGITIDKHISVGHIFTTIAAIVAGVSAYASMQNRLYNLEKEDVRIQAQIEKHEKQYQTTLDRIYIQLEKINDKLDQKADK